MPWKKYPMAAGTIFPISVIESEGWFWTVERKQLHKLRIPGVGELVAKLDKRGLAAPHDVGITGNESHDDNALERAPRMARMSESARHPISPMPITQRMNAKGMSSVRISLAAL